MNRLACADVMHFSEESVRTHIKVHISVDVPLTSQTLKMFDCGISSCIRDT